MENTVQNMEDSLRQATGFLQGEFTIGSFSLQKWIVYAAVSGLLFIALVVIVILSEKKRKVRMRQEIVPDAPHTEMEEAGFEDLMGGEAGGILSIGDEDTVNLEEDPTPQTPIAPVGGGIVMETDGDTTDLPGSIEPPAPPKLTYLVIAQMHYNGLGNEQQVMLVEDESIVIGRGDGQDVAIHTNPSDTSISHHHGVFYVQNGQPWYRDESRNGTVINGTRHLTRGESLQLPRMTKIQMEIGTHKIMLYIARQQ